MKRVRVIPVLLLKNSGLVKTIKFRKPNYLGDPINAVKIFNEKEVDEIVLLDIEATLLNREPNFEKIGEICSEAFMPFAYGGGIRNLDQIKKLFNVGIEKVIINSESFFNPRLIEQAAYIYGNQSIVVSIDVKKSVWGKYYVYVKSGKQNTKISPVDHAKKMEEYGAGEIILTAIDREGTFNNYDFDLISQVAEQINIPLVANGGASNIASFYDAIKAGASAIAAGSLFVYRSKTRGILINYPNQQDLKMNLFSKLK